MQGKEIRNEIKKLEHAFKPNDVVRIVEPGGKTKTTYVIKKLKKSSDGIPLYLLKSDSDPVMLLYYETKDSHLEKTN